MQTLRKKASPFKYKNDPSRFMGDGMNFKAKLIGILEVNEARGDRMCQEALAELKVVVRVAGEHKQRIVINIAIDGLRLKDERTGDSLHHHPVHKISFIAQDTTDTRAFGYIFGSPDTGHRFFGLKTDKAASMVVVAMRDLFQVVFELKKKEIEHAKQSINEQHKFRYGNLLPKFPDSILSAAKNLTPSKLLMNDNDYCRYTLTETKHHDISRSGSPSSRKDTSNEAIADLLDLELELNNIQQGISQMEKLTPCGPSEPLLHRADTSEDPFGDSFTKFFIPPPPPSNRTAHRNLSSSTAANTSVYKPDAISFNPLRNFNLKNQAVHKNLLLSSSTENTTNIPATNFDMFVDLDPLGTGKNKPYVDKKLFFNDIKNPPKVPLNPSYQQGNFVAETDPRTKTAAVLSNLDDLYKKSAIISNDPFDDMDPFAVEQSQSQPQSVCSAVVLQQSRTPPILPPRDINQFNNQPPPPPRPPPATKNALSYDNSCNDSPPLPKPNRKIPSSRYIGVQSTSFSVKEEDEYLTPVHKEDFVLNLERLSELSEKLNIPTSQLSNMTISQLTDLLSKFKQDRKSPILPPPQRVLTNSPPISVPPKTLSDYIQEPIVDRYSALRDIKLDENDDNDNDNEMSELNTSKISVSSVSESPLTTMQSARSTILAEEENAVDDDDDKTAQNTSSFEDAVEVLHSKDDDNTLTKNSGWANFDDQTFDYDNSTTEVEGNWDEEQESTLIEEAVLEKDVVIDSYDDEQVAIEPDSVESSSSLCSSDNQSAPAPAQLPKNSPLSIFSKQKYPHHQVIYQKVPIRPSSSSSNHRYHHHHRHNHHQVQPHCRHGSDCKSYDGHNSGHVDSEDEDAEDEYDDEEDDDYNDGLERRFHGSDDSCNRRQYEMLRDQKYTKHHHVNHHTQLHFKKKTAESCYCRNKVMEECSCCYASRSPRPKSGGQNKYSSRSDDRYASLQRPSSATDVPRLNYSINSVGSLSDASKKAYTQTLSLPKSRYNNRRSRSRDSNSNDAHCCSEETELFLNHKLNQPIGSNKICLTDDCKSECPPKSGIESTYFSKPKYVTGTEKRLQKPKPRFHTKTPKTGFEDDFDPPKINMLSTSVGSSVLPLTESLAGDSGISSITEEMAGFEEEADGPFTLPSSTVQGSHNEIVTATISTIPTSESVNIFQIDEDPFDDDFFRQSLADFEKSCGIGNQKQQFSMPNDNDKVEEISDSEWIKKFKTFDD